MPLRVLVEDLQALLEVVGSAEEPEIRVPELGDEILALADGGSVSPPLYWS
jgi:hypothetical protein